VEAIQEQFPAAEMERAMKIQDVILNAMAGKLKWWEAAEIIGVTGPCPASGVQRTAAPLVRRRRNSLAPVVWTSCDSPHDAPGKPGECGGNRGKPQEAVWRPKPGHTGAAVAGRWL
jgi:hypothetical protein